jgi:acyl-[acyl-carrier-protein]-phospholipid O-acyltransferase/long-chain-fatty-acid--[acyl-carrier-protein] ligase
MPKSLWNRGFIALLITQFTVAFNDNAFRWLIVPIGKAYADGDFIRTLGAFFLLVPFLLWASIAGFVTDRFSRRNVMIWSKTIEMLLLAAAVGVIMFGPAVSGEPVQGTFSMPWSIICLLVILFLIGSQAAFFSPSKYGTIPDLVPTEKLSAANGLVSMLTMVACVSGQVIGGYLFAWTTLFHDVPRVSADVVDKVVLGVPGGNHIWVTALCLVGVSAIGVVSSFFIPKMKPVDATAKFPVNFLHQTGKDIAFLFSYRKLFWIAAASAFFWGLAALTQNNIDKFATEYLMVQQQYVTPLLAILLIGIGIGAVFCGWISGRRIELGIVPFGLCGMGVFVLLLGFTPGYGEVVGAGMGDPM